MGLIDKSLHYAIYKVLKLDISENKFREIRDFLKFGIVGISNTIVTYLVYLAVLSVLEALGYHGEYDYLIATLFGFVISVLWAFYWNKRFVFKKNYNLKETVSALIKTYISYSFTGLFLNSILAVLWVEIVGISKLVSPIINIMICLPANYLLNKFWAFRN